MNSIHTAIHRLHNPDLGILLIRLALGMVFISSGWMKVTNLEGAVAFFGTLGIPALLAYLVAYIELVGGIAFILGVLVRYFGILTAIIMAVAISKVHWASGFDPSKGGYEYVLVLLLASLALVTLGAGEYSLARLTKNRY